MTLPLVVLAVLAVVGGVLNLPFTERHASSSSTGSSRWSSQHEAPARRRPPAPRSPWPSSPRSCALVGIARRLPASTCSTSVDGPVEPELLAARLVLRRGDRRVHGRARPQGASRPSPAFDRTVIDGAVNGVGHASCAAARRRRPHGPDRLRPQLRARHRRRRRRCSSRFVLTEVVVLMIAACSPPRHAVRPASRSSPPWCCSPVVGALVVALIPKRRPELAPAGRRAVRRRHRRAHASSLLATFRPPRRRLPVRGRPDLDQRPRHRPGTSASTASRCSWSCSPASCSRSPCSAPTPHHDAEAVLRLAARCSRPAASGVFLRARPLPVLRDVRDRARADVLPHRRLGLRRARLRRHQVLPLHDVRLGVHARRHRRHSPSCTSAASGGPITFDLVTIADSARHRQQHRPAGCSSASPSPSR